MRLNNFLKLTSILGLVGYVNCGGYKMTFYGLNGNRPSDKAIPACGLDVHYNTDYYVALNKEEYTESQVKADNPNTAQVCDKCVKITYEGKWVVGRVVDSCPGCPRHGLDVSPTIFEVFAHQDVGVLYMDWEYTDCSSVGKSGSCSGGKCTVSSKSSGDDEEKSEKKKTTTKKSTTRKSTTSVRKTTSVKVSTTPIVIKTINKTKTVTQINTTKLVGTIAKTTINRVATATPKVEKVSNNEANEKVNENKSNQVIEETISETDKGDGNNYVLPVTGALAVTGAAGVALVIAKRDSKNINNLKEKFPEAFSNIKRSISRGSTAVRRSLSQSGQKLKRSLSKRGDNSQTYGAVGPQFRTKKEYRDSLNAHYPLQPVQLYDPPVPSATTYNAVPQYNLKHYNTNNDDGNLHIDFHDTYH